jgi:hypothetical protein
LKKLYRTLAAALALLAPSSPGWGLQLSDLITECRAELRDTTTDTNFQRFTNAQLTGFLNDAQNQIDNTVGLLSVSYGFDLVAGQREYALPLDYKAAWRVTLSGQRLPATSYNALDQISNWTVARSTPTAYYINTYSSSTASLIMGFYPTPRLSTTGGSVQIFYAQIPTQMVNLTDLPFNGRSNFAPYHYALSHYCAFRGWLVQNRPDLAKGYADVFASDVKMMKESISEEPDYNPSVQGYRGPPSQSQ